MKYSVLLKHRCCKLWKTHSPGDTFFSLSFQFSAARHKLTWLVSFHFVTNALWDKNVRSSWQYILCFLKMRRMIGNQIWENVLESRCPATTTEDEDVFGFRQGEIEMILGKYDGPVCWEQGHPFAQLWSHCLAFFFFFLISCRRT